MRRRGGGEAGSRPYSARTREVAVCFQPRHSTRHRHEQNLLHSCLPDHCDGRPGTGGQYQCRRQEHAVVDVQRGRRRADEEARADEAPKAGNDGETLGWKNDKTGASDGEKRPGRWKPVGPDADQK